MKHLILIFCCAISLQALGQEWQKVDQSYYGCKYELPKDASIDGFGGEDWEQVGSSVCDCAGSINSFPNSSFNPSKDVVMVLYVSRYKDSLQNDKRMHVWDMKFADTQKKSKLVTKKNKIAFEKKISTWAEGTEQEGYKDAEVWRFTTEGKGQYYMLYFIALPTIMRKNEKNILRVLDSFTIMKAN